MQKILSKREKLIVFSTIGIIIFSIAFNIFIEPFLAKNDSLNKEIHINRLKLKKYLQLLNQKEYIQNKYDKFSKALIRPEAGADVFVNALSTIEDIAKSSNIRIIDIRPQVQQKGQDLYKEIIVEMRAEGEVSSYLQFLYNIENSLSLLRIRRLQLSSKPNVSLLEGNFVISQVSLE